MKKKTMIILSILLVLAVIVCIAVTLVIISREDKKSQRVAVNTYMSYIKSENYDKMYDMLDSKSKEKYSKDNFFTRNKNIYAGMDLSDISINITSVEKIENNIVVKYDSILQTSGGEVSFSNTANLVKEEGKYKIVWSSNIIHPKLMDEDKVRIKTLASTRGSIYDRNNNMLAGKGQVSAIGFVPGKMNKENEDDIKKIAEILEMSEESIKKLLSASYVKDDTFVQLKKVQKDDEVIDKVLEVKGIKVISVESRVYPLGECMSHIVGYVQNISSEELEEHKNEGYTQSSIIGKIGLEKQYEKRLKGVDGVEIYIEDEKGNKKEIIARQELKDGEDVIITIDSNLQKKIYENAKDIKGFFVVMNPDTGEMLSMVSTPSYDSNDFALGISNKKWNELNESESKPLYNRFLSTWCPGSTFKPVTGAIGITTNKVDPNKDFGHSGLSYKKDDSWGDYKITTLREYSQPANMKNALINSDNIYFAKATLDIGAKLYAESLDKIGFNKAIDFQLDIAKSTYSDDGKFDSEIGLADTGYGQGKLLVNPIFMASVYSAFVNEGNMLLPILEYDENAEKKYYIKEAFSKEAADIIFQDLVQVVESPNGTASNLKIKGVQIAAKTGTAELKKDKESEGEELSWLNAISKDKSLLVVGMREGTKNVTATSSLFPKIKAIFEQN